MVSLPHIDTNWEVQSPFYPKVTIKPMGENIGKIY